ncbi:MAG: VOC family protein [Bdellovibrionaceae bacterium]|nr:VOC family protein [Pseudobdellovibrionaceae bacterium]
MNLSKNFKGTYGTMYYVKDMNKTVQYYKDMFNLTPEDESPEWTTFSFDGHRICLHACGEKDKVEGNGILITNVTKLDEMVVELKKRGVEFIKDITQVCEGGYSADFKDPSGNIVSLFEYKG